MLDVTRLTDVSLLQQVTKLQERELERLREKVREQSKLIAKLQNKTDAQLLLELERLEEHRGG